MGRNHTFGRDAAGTPATLAALREEYGFRLYVMPGVNWGETVSSTRIRDCIRHGDTDSAKAMLGYDYGFCGQVQRGRHIGTSLGFPTANIEFPEDKVSPPDGGVLRKREYRRKTARRNNEYRHASHIR